MERTRASRGRGGRYRGEDGQAPAGSAAPQLTLIIPFFEV